jgi:hypothetical protein
LATNEKKITKKKDNLALVDSEVLLVDSEVLLVDSEVLSEDSDLLSVDSEVLSVDLEGLGISHFVFGDLGDSDSRFQGFVVFHFRFLKLIHLCGRQLPYGVARFLLENLLRLY